MLTGLKLVTAFCLRKAWHNTLRRFKRVVTLSMTGKQYIFFYTYIMSFSYTATLGSWCNHVFIVHSEGTARWGNGVGLTKASTCIQGNIKYNTVWDVHWSSVTWKQTRNSSNSLSYVLLRRYYLDRNRSPCKCSNVRYRRVKSSWGNMQNTNEYQRYGKSNNVV